MGIRPSFRGKGFGDLLMKLSIQELCERGVKEIHIHCHKDNKASARIIISSGGRLQSEFAENKEVIQRYVINVA